MNPKARKTALVVQEVGGELVIYDEKRHRVHNLSSTAARVWRLCDGVTSETEVARRLAEETNTPVDEALVRFSLAELGRAKLLEGMPATTEETPALSRRQFMRKAVVAAGMALALPVITSMIAPVPANAQDPAGPKDECKGDYPLQKNVTIIGTGKDCEEAQKNANKDLYAFTDEKCMKRKCPKQAKCYGVNAKLDGRCKKDGNKAVYTYTVSGYSCSCFGP